MKNLLMLILSILIASCSIDQMDEGLIGPQGEQGISGEKGEKGDQGESGEDGMDGVDGTNGTDGTDGTDGEDGADGADGNDGEDGTDGQDGNDGVSCVSYVEQEFLIDFEDKDKGFYSYVDGVKVETNGYLNKLIVDSEDSNNKKFGTDSENNIAFIASNANGRYRSSGGVISFIFDSPVHFKSIDFLDSDHRNDNIINVIYFDGSQEVFTIQKYPEPYSSETVNIDHENVISIEVFSKESFAIDNLVYSQEVQINNCD